MCRGASAFRYRLRHLGLIEHNERFNELVGNFAESCQPSGAIGGTSG